MYKRQALLFASNRWGDGEYPFDYSRQAKQILAACVHKGEGGEEGDPMWDPTNKPVSYTHLDVYKRQEQKASTL